MMKNIFLITALISFITISCTKSDPSSITVSATTISADANGMQTSVNINSNTEWSASASDTWVLITPANGKGNSVLNIQVQANEKTDSRNATITVITKDGAASSSITISQAGVIAKIAVSPESISAEESSILTSATITSNTEWRAKSSDAWVKSKRAIYKRYKHKTFYTSASTHYKSQSISQEEADPKGQLLLYLPTHSSVSIRLNAYCSLSFYVPVSS